MLASTAKEGKEGPYLWMVDNFCCCAGCAQAMPDQDPLWLLSGLSCPVRAASLDIYADHLCLHSHSTIS